METEFLSLNQAANQLGVSAMRVRQLAAEGKLPFVGKRFARSAVETLRKEREKGAPRIRNTSRTEAALSLRAFALFKAGLKLEDVMRELELTPQRVRALYKEWQTPLGGSAPRALPPLPTFAELSERSEKEGVAFASEFDRDQVERKRKAERDHADRLHEHEQIAERIRERKTR